MTPQAAAILSSPYPSGHIVYPYTDENLVSQAVCLYASSGLRNGEGVILILTQPHLESITRRLVAEGFDIETLTNTGQLACILAEDLLPVIMVDGMPDGDLFLDIAVGLIQRCQTSLKNGEKHVRIFGEMVCLLWNENLPAAQRLEELWNTIIATQPIALLCTYCLSKNPKSPSLPESLVTCHAECLA